MKIIIILSVIVLMLISFELGTTTSLNDDVNININNTDKPSTIVYPSNHYTNIECYSTNCKFDGYLKVSNSIGKSMLPTIVPGSKVIIDINIKTTDLKVGDIIVYKNYDNVYISHRLIFINETHFIALGDNNKYQDIAFPIDRIEGVIIAIFY